MSKPTLQNKLENNQLVTQRYERRQHIVRYTTRNNFINHDKN